MTSELLYHLRLAESLLIRVTSLNVCGIEICDIVAYRGLTTKCKIFQENKTEDSCLVFHKVKVPSKDSS